jgi:hypothetical protein
VVGADIPDWSTAPRIATLGHRIPQTIGLPATNRDDIAVVRLAVLTVQSHGSVGRRRTPRRRPHRGRRVWLHQRPTRLQSAGHQAAAASQTVLDEITSCGTDEFSTILYDAPSSISTKGTRRNSTVNRGDSGGPLLVRDGCGGFQQAGVTSLGSDSTDKLYASFISLPVAAQWIAEAIETLRNG